MSDIRILPHVETDLAIPPVALIRARAADLRADATHQHDTDRSSQMRNLIDALDQGIRMAWVLGDLLVSSASTHGTIYTVSCGACDCPARKPCKHLALAEVLLDLFATDCDSADADAEPAADDEDGWDGGIGSDGGIGYDAFMEADAAFLKNEAQSIGMRSDDKDGGESDIHEECAAADIEADAAAPNPQPLSSNPRHLGARLAAARAVYSLNVR